MQNKTHVTLILDKNCTHDLFKIAEAGPVWIVDSSSNQKLISDASKVKTFEITPLYVNGSTPKEWFLNHIDTVDQHHNEYSQSPEYTDLNVVGVHLSRDIEDFLPEFNFTEWEETEYGFNAYKR